jgi:NAD-dependent dihydropyrimidine dehydrogenase PreA subunit
MVREMTIVVTDNCQLCRFTGCVAVCPVACFHAGDEMLYIDNDILHRLSSLHSGLPGQSHSGRGGSHVSPDVLDRRQRRKIDGATSDR